MTNQANFRESTSTSSCPKMQRQHQKQDRPLVLKWLAEMAGKEIGSAKQVMMRCSSVQNTKLRQCDSPRTWKRTVVHQRVVGRIK